jgi:hypothetical protein
MTAAFVTLFVAANFPVWNTRSEGRQFVAQIKLIKGWAVEEKQTFEVIRVA